MMVVMALCAVSEPSTPVAPMIQMLCAPEAVPGMTLKKPKVSTASVAEAATALVLAHGYDPRHRA